MMIITIVATKSNNKFMACGDEWLECTGYCVLKLVTFCTKQKMLLQIVSCYIYFSSKKCEKWDYDLLKVIFGTSHLSYYVTLQLNKIQTMYRRCIRSTHPGRFSRVNHHRILLFFVYYRLTGLHYFILCLQWNGYNSSCSVAFIIITFF